MCQVDNKNEAAHGVSSLAVWGQNTQLWALKSETLPTVHNIWPSTLIIPGCYFSADSYESGTCRETFWGGSLWYFRGSSWRQPPHDAVQFAVRCSLWSLYGKVPHLSNRSDSSPTPDVFISWLIMSSPLSVPFLCHLLSDRGRLVYNPKHML